jgi:hypothetical protein
MATKIGYLRDEFERIGCIPPKNPFEPCLYVGWHFTEIMVTGLYEELFEYEVLAAILAKVPTGAGEAVFWKTVHGTNIKVLIDQLNRQTRFEVVR